jgi:dynein heavy chain
MSYLRDTSENLSSKKIKDQTDFEWQKCFKVYIHEESSNESMNVPKFYVFSDSYNFGTEFYGSEQNTIITPSTERYYLSIWHATRLLRGACVLGHSNYGKTQTVKGLAQFFGKFLSILNCTSQTDHSSISSYILGVAQEGTWGFFDEIQNLSDLCVSWLNEYASGVYQCIRRRSSQALLADGKEVKILSRLLRIKLNQKFINYFIHFSFI